MDNRFGYGWRGRIRKSRFRKPKLAFFIGSEEKGLSDEIKNKLDNVVRIQMSKNIESLNVSVAAGIAMQHIFIKK